MATKQQQRFLSAMAAYMFAAEMWRVLDFGWLSVTANHMSDHVEYRFRFDYREKEYHLAHFIPWHDIESLDIDSEVEVSGWQKRAHELALQWIDEACLAVDNRDKELETWQPQQ